MCHYFEFTYACGHSDVIEGPCEWRDEDFERVCMACSSQGLGDSGRSTERETDRIFLIRPPIEIIIRNEAWLRKRACRRNLVGASPTQSFSLPSQYELEVQFRVNAEFLARRHQRRCFYRHEDGIIHYQDFLEAYDAHWDAKEALKNIAPVQDTSQGTRPQSPQGVTGHGGYEKERKNVQQAEISDPERGVEQKRSDVLSLGGGRREGHQEGLGSASESENEDSPQPLHTTRRFEHDADRDDPQQQREDQVDNFSTDVSAEGSQPDDATISPPYERPISRRANSREPIVQRTGSSTSSSNCSTTSSESDEFHFNRLAPNSPEGISRLAQCRKFLGMSPDASPTQVFNVIDRDKVLRDSISRGLIPRHHRPRIPSQKAHKFAIETGPCLVMKIENDRNWQARENFVQAWNSIDWSRRPVNVDGWLDEVEVPDSASLVVQVPLDMTMPASTQFVNFAGVQHRPPHLPQVLSPLRISHTYSKRHSPASEESCFSDSSSSSSSSDSFDSLPSNEEYILAPEHIGVREEQTYDTNGQEAMGGGCSRNGHYESSYAPQNRGLVMTSSPYGQALLAGLYQCLSFPQSRDPFELSLFIDRHPKLMNAIKVGIIPYNKSKPKETRLLLKTEPDERFALMRGEFFHALSILDWDEIDTASTPFKRKLVVKPVEILDWDNEAQAQGLRKRITLSPSVEIRLGKIKGLKEHRVKVFSPLRWSYTRAEGSSEEEKTKRKTAQASPDLRWTLYNTKAKLEQAKQQNVVRRAGRKAAELDEDLDDGGELEEELMRKKPMRGRGIHRDAK